MNALKSWGNALGMAVFGGLIISALLPDAEFVNGLEIFRGVKVAILLPLLAAGWIFYGPGALKKLANAKVTVWGGAAALAAAGALLILLARSGNNAGPPPAWELQIRALLEQLLCARPRFKEFVIGHPLMIFGVWLALREKSGLRLEESRAGEVRAHLPHLALWIGSLGLISVVNSFCHLHTPVATTLLRTFHGAWMGALIGLLLIGLFLWAERRSSRV